MVVKGGLPRLSSSALSSDLHTVPSTELGTALPLMKNFTFVILSFSLPKRR